METEVYKKSKNKISESTVKQIRHCEHDNKKE